MRNEEEPDVEFQLPADSLAGGRSGRKRRRKGV